MYATKNGFSRYWLFMVLAILGYLAAAPAVAAPGAKLLKNIPVTQEVADRTLDGNLSITEITLGEQGQLLASGVLRGKWGNQNFNQAFTAVPMNLSENEDGTMSIAQNGGSNECDILFLDLGPISLDLLGLQVDLSDVQLDITAVAGPGNLLGNLLCAVAGLLDNFSLNNVLSNILNNLLNGINELL